MTLKPSTFDKGVSELEFVNLKEIVLRLKAVKEKDNLSIADIMERLEAAGEFLSESTVRRVFKDNSENELGFTYQKVLRPIADVILNEEDETADDPALLEKNEALHSIVREKNRIIESLQSKVELLEKQNDTIKSQIDDIRKSYDARIDSLWEQIHIKDRRMDEKDEIIRKLMDKCL